MNLPPIEEPNEQRRHALYGDVAEKIGQSLMELIGLSMDDAAQIGNALADFLAGQWKGQYIYFTADTPYRHNQRDLDIYRRMGRGMAPVLAQEYGISTMRVYQIYRRMLELQRSKLQPDLFATPVHETALVSAQEALAETQEPHQ